MEWKWPAAIVLVVAIVLAVAVAIGLGNSGDPDPSTGPIDPIEPMTPSDTPELIYPATFPSDIDPEFKKPISAAEASEAYDAQIDALVGVLKDRKLSVDDLVEEILDAYEVLITMSTYNVFVTLNYHLYPEDNADEYIDWNAFMQEAEDSFYVALKEGLNSSNSKNVEKAVESLGLESHFIKGYGSTSKKEQELLAKEDSLIVKYYGMDVTTSNKDAITDIYIDLVKVRNDLAQLYGYSNYAEYAYGNLFGRDYSPNDVSELYDAMGPSSDLYKKLSKTSDKLSNIKWVNYLTEEDKTDMLRPMLSEISPDMLLLLDYMEDEGLLYIDSVKGQLPGAYTMSLSVYDSALIYIPWSNSRGFNSLVHEFGHASNMCLNPGETRCYDIMEIHSQGLEALFSAGYTDTVKDGSLFGAYSLYSLVNGVFTGLFITEFENWAYETEASTGTLTRADVYSEYGRIMSSYFPNYNPQYWQNVHHVFDRPCYYISYATSGLSALEIFASALSDLDATQEKYLALIYQEGIDGYVDAVTSAGLSNMMLAENYQAILATIADWVDRNIK